MNLETAGRAARFVLLTLFTGTVIVLGWVLIWAVMALGEYR